MPESVTKVTRDLALLRTKKCTHRTINLMTGRYRFIVKTEIPFLTLP